MTTVRRTVRLVFVGPPGAGAAVSVRWLAENVPAASRTGPVEHEDLLFARLVGLRVPGVAAEEGLDVELTTPVAHAGAETRRRALAEADAIVFVAHADGRPANEDAWRVLEADRASLPPGPRPLVLQLDGEAPAAQREAVISRFRDHVALVSATVALAGRGLLDLLVGALGRVDAPVEAAPAPPSPVVAAPLESVDPLPPLTGDAAPEGAVPAPGTGAPASGPVPGRLRRSAKVRWYRRMTVRRHHPVLVAFGPGSFGEADGDVGQAEGRPLHVPAARPVVTVVPVFPGCLCAPAQIQVDLTARVTDVRLWVTPLGTGALDDARVEIWHEGRRIDAVATPALVRSPTWARVSAVLSVLAPLATLVLKHRGQHLADWMAAFLARALPALEPVLDRWGPYAPALGLASAGLLATALLARWARPRRADPVEAAFTLPDRA